MAGYNPKAGARDMLLSLAVLLVPIVLIVWFFQTTPDEPPLPAVNWKTTVETARGQAKFPVLAPRELPSAWQVTSSYWETKGTQVDNRVLGGDEFSLGMLDNDRMHLSVKQSDAPAAAWLKVAMRQAHQVGEVTVEGSTWTTWLSSDGRTHYLTREVGASTAVLTADGAQEPLVALAGMLDES